MDRDRVRAALAVRLTPGRHNAAHPLAAFARGAILQKIGHGATDFLLMSNRTRQIGPVEPDKLHIGTGDPRTRVLADSQDAGNIWDAARGQEVQAGQLLLHGTFVFAEHVHGERRRQVDTLKEIEVQIDNARAWNRLMVEWQVQ